MHKPRSHLDAINMQRLGRSFRLPINWGRATLLKMSKAIRQSVAIFLMLWLPIFSGSALAMVACPHSMSPDASMTAAEHANHNNTQQTQKADNGLSCDQCGLCHMTCSPGITSSLNSSATLASSAENPAPISLFRSITLPFFDPPPLVLA